MENLEDPQITLLGELCDLVKILDFSVQCFICKAVEETCKTSLGLEMYFSQWPVVHSPQVLDVTQEILPPQSFHRLLV